MVQVLHTYARTTKTVRECLQASQASLGKLAKRYTLNPKTVAKGKRRNFVQDRARVPQQKRSTVLSLEEEAAMVAFRKHPLLPLDDGLYALHTTIPHLTRSGLHRCLQPHGIGRLPAGQGDKPAKKKFKPYPLGYFHIDRAQVSTEDGKLYLFVAIDRASKFADAQWHEHAHQMIAAQFLCHLINPVPYQLPTVLTDNGIPLTNRKTDHFAFPHIFSRVCQENSIEHRFTQLNHPRTPGQLERMNRTLKEATLKKYPYPSHPPLKTHFYHFLNAYHFAKPLKSLRGLSPYEFILKIWQNDPHRFRLNPSHHTRGLNS